MNVTYCFATCSPKRVKSGARSEKRLLLKSSPSSAASAGRESTSRTSSIAAVSLSMEGFFVGRMPDQANFWNWRFS